MCYQGDAADLHTTLRQFLPVRIYLNSYQWRWRSLILLSPYRVSSIVDTLFPAGIGTKPHCPSLIDDAGLFLHDINNGMRRAFVKFTQEFADAKPQTLRLFDNRNLHPQANTQKRYISCPCKVTKCRFSPRFLGHQSHPVSECRLHASGYPPHCFSLTSSLSQPTGY